MHAIELDGVTKRWDKTTAVDDVSFAVESGSFVVLLGPSGCGKSTTLRMIAGLEEISKGHVRIDDRDMTNEPPSRRNLSMVFQSYALFPHLNVRENILFGLKVRRVERGEQGARLRRVADLVGLSDLLDRRPAQLSGGQRQRVALARAVIAENPICLMDEPLSNLDAKLRHSMRVEIRELQQRLGMTVIYVTHDQTEAMSMADRIILLRDGRIEQDGAPDDLYSIPASTFVASFIGAPPMNLITLADGTDGAVIEGAGQAVARGAGAGRLLGIRPEHIEIMVDGGMPASLTASDYLGADTIVTAQIGEQDILVRVPGHRRVGGGEAVRVGWSRETAHIFDAATGRRVGYADSPVAANLSARSLRNSI
jgi:sn-glycerol 3-phosphate transport system ATP-binding protein